MLGIVDEILQGIHPQRTYGWKDMIIDTVSGFIGVLMLVGFKKTSRGDWTWIRQLQKQMLIGATPLRFSASCIL